MLTTLLVPLDGSSLAERALPYASALSRAAGARVVLVRAIMAHTLPGTDPTGTQITLRQQAEAYLDEIARRLQQTGVTAVDPHVYYDEAVEAILDATHVQRADLVVMSTHGRTGIGRWLYGSVADEVLRRSRVPVLLVPPACAPAWDPARPQRVLVPLDGSSLAEEILPAVTDLARTLRAEVLLLRVIEYPVPVLGDGTGYVTVFDEETERADAEAYLAQVARRLMDAGLSVATEVVVSPPTVVGQVPATIADVARDRAATLIALATHGRGGLARLVLGSVATGVLQRANVPLLLTRPAAVGAAAAPRAAAAPLTLTPLERDLVCRGLRTLLHGAPDRTGAPGRPLIEGAEATAAAALLARLEQHEPAGRARGTTGG